MFVVAPGNLPTPSRRRHLALFLVFFGALASPASKSEPTRRDQPPQKLKNWAVYATTTPCETIDSITLLFTT